MANRQNVKSTMMNSLLSRLAPHYCCSCGEIGGLLCESCKYDIIQEPGDTCLLCGSPVATNRGCGQCRSVVERTWYVGMRSGGLERLIDTYKFDNAKSAYAPLGDLLLATIPDLPPHTLVVPVPTIRSHIRQRGYDHTLLVAQYVAKRRGLVVKRLLCRQTGSVQRGADRKQRLLQAKIAFGVRHDLDINTPCLLIDDVVTTGATMTYAALALRSAGATTVWAAAVARQPIDH